MEFQAFYKYIFGDDSLALYISLSLSLPLFYS